MVEGRLSRELLLHGDDLTSVELGLNFGRRAVLQRGMDPHVIEPIDPAEGGEFEIVSAFPGSFPVDELGLVEAVHGLGEGVVQRRQMRPIRLVAIELSG